MANRETSLNTSNSDSECKVSDQRVSRFLSTIDPEEIKKFAQLNSSIAEEDESFDGAPARPPVKADTKKQSAKNISDGKQDKLKIKSYHDGSGIPQNVKAEIIRSIIQNLDVDGYVNKMMSSDIVEINNADLRPARDLLIKLMKSDIVRINDKKYMKELERKLQDSYEQDQNKLMDALAEKERQRERKLEMLDITKDKSILEKCKHHW